MFRRRGGFRPGRRGFAPAIPPRLQRANQLLANGNYAEAALAFLELARGAEDRFPERAPFLYLQAGRAAILDGQTQMGIAHLRRGLTMLGTQGRFVRMQNAGQHAVEELNARGLSAEAAEIAELINGNIPQRSEHETSPARKPTLPTHCPNCGGSLRPDEVEWLDDLTAECTYCGSPVRGD
ncbi:MAG: hypothetical protein HZB19_17235 [Chloroflexi bacterium]|nr:hypothetical protein [Chloroflexota bacterium]